MTYQSPSGYPGPRSVQPYDTGRHPYGLPAPPEPTPPPPPPDEKRRWPWIIGVVVVVAILGVGLFTLVRGRSGADPAGAGTTAAAAQMGQAATDGGLQFMVSGMKCGAKTVGGDLLGRQAKGEYCILDISVQNVGGGARKFATMPQKASDSTGAEYTADSVAGTYANTDQPKFLADIAPGDTVSGELVFDVAPGSKLTTVELHESMTSPGVRVPLK